MRLSQMDLDHTKEDPQNKTTPHEGEMTPSIVSGILTYPDTLLQNINNQSTYSNSTEKKISKKRKRDSDERVEHVAKKTSLLSTTTERLPDLDQAGLTDSNQNVFENAIVMKKGKWSNSEKKQLAVLISEYGGDTGHFTKAIWREIANKMQSRTVAQIKERWQRHQNPTINKSPWTAEEDRILIEKVQKIGKRWKTISEFFPGRIDFSAQKAL